MKTNDSNEQLKTPTTVSSGDLLGGKWKYFRDAKNQVSKWTLGNNWVTKWDTDTFCTIGINGVLRHSWMIEEPANARKCVEDAIMPPNEKS